MTGLIVEDIPAGEAQERREDDHGAKNGESGKTKDNEGGSHGKNAPRAKGAATSASMARLFEPAPAPTGRLSAAGSARCSSGGTSTTSSTNI